jgi:phosphoenolpyruvate synthase/pyruvate phosphate dikinase
MSIWFDPNELYKINKFILKKVIKDPFFVDQVEESVHYVWQELQPFINKKKLINTIVEFKFFFNSYILWWSHVSIFMIIPNIKEIPLIIRKRALEIRLKYEKFSDISDQLLLQYFEKKFSNYKNISNVISPDEIVSLARNTLISKNLNLIKKRNKDGWVLVNGELSSFDNIESLLNKYHLELSTNIVERNIDKFLGFSAYKGNIKGVVKLVLDKKDLKKIQKANVLVSDATTPDFLPAMKKAVAIITDEGGIICHAAIVSRELKIPCIIGTKIATQVLKDGDLVEVDANKGIVKILKKSK